MADFINTIEALGDDAVIDSIIDRTITEFKDDSLANVGHSAFRRCTALETVHLPNTTEIGDFAFEGCTALADVSLPNVTAIRPDAFYASGLREADFSKLTVCGERAFYQCKNLTRVSLPLLEYFPYMFVNGCISMTEFYAPLIPIVSVNGIRGCSSLKRLDLPSVTAIQQYAFYGDVVLDTLILRSSASVVTLENTDCLGRTPIADGAGYIYVPRALVASYQAASNWSTFAAQFRALEDYTVDGTITGALDENKI